MPCSPCAGPQLATLAVLERKASGRGCTPHSSLLTPHSSLRTLHSSLFTREARLRALGSSRSTAGLRPTKLLVPRPARPPCAFPTPRRCPLRWAHSVARREDDGSAAWSLNNVAILAADVHSWPLRLEAGTPSRLHAHACTAPPPLGSRAESYGPPGPCAPPCRPSEAPPLCTPASLGLAFLASLLSASFLAYLPTHSTYLLTPAVASSASLGDSSRENRGRRYATLVAAPPHARGAILVAAQLARPYPGLLGRWGELPRPFGCATHS